MRADRGLVGFELDRPVLATFVCRHCGRACSARAERLNTAIVEVLRQQLRHMSEVHVSAHSEPDAWPDELAAGLGDAP